LQTDVFCGAWRFQADLGLHEGGPQLPFSASVYFNFSGLKNPRLGFEIGLIEIWF
jgi:hypothetical protein